MSSRITRTIISHVIILGDVIGTEISLRDPEMRPDSYRVRELNQLSKEAGHPVVVIDDHVVEEKRSMTLEDFIKYSVADDVNEENVEM